MRGFRILIAMTVFLAVFGVGVFLYMTREIAAPSEAVQASVQQLDTASDGSGEALFRISQDDSQVTYTINEVLNGAPKTVVGITDQVAGDILLNLADLAQSQVGEISINARTFATDDDRRDNSVARFILQSEQAANEFITFQPTSISGLPQSSSAGDTLNFQVIGDLTIAGVTQQVSFDVTASLDSDHELVGSAETQVAYSDFNLSIPNVPFVASVEDSVILQLNFVATAVSSGLTSAA